MTDTRVRLGTCSNTACRGSVYIGDRFDMEAARSSRLRWFDLYHRGGPPHADHSKDQVTP